MSVIMNNDAGTNMAVYPASGDDLGLGANNALTLPFGQMVTLFCYGTSQWAGHTNTMV